MRNRIVITVLATVVVVSMIGTALSGRENAKRLMTDLQAESQVLTSVFGDTLGKGARSAVGMGQSASAHSSNLPKNPVGARRARLYDARRGSVSVTRLSRRVVEAPLG